MELIISGKKTGTCSALALYQGEEIPSERLYQIVQNGTGKPVCVIQNTKVECLPFCEITDRHAKMEGEGDLSLVYWQKVHRQFFERAFQMELGRSFTEEDLLVFEEFQVVYK